MIMRQSAISRRELFFNCAVVVASALFSLLVVFPRRGQIARKNERIRAISTEIDERMRELKDLEGALGREAALEEFQVGREEDLIPRLLEFLARLGSRHRLEIVSLKPMPQVEISLPPSEGIDVQAKKIEIKVVVRAGYRELGSYLEDLEKIPVLVALRGLRIVKDEPGSRLLRGEFVIETYLLRAYEKKA